MLGSHDSHADQAHAIDVIVGITPHSTHRLEFWRRKSANLCKREEKAFGTNHEGRLLRDSGLFGCDGLKSCATIPCRWKVLPWN